MPEPSQNRITKAMRGLSIGTVLSLKQAERRHELEGLREVEEQIQLEFGGLATEFPTFVEEDVRFVQHFVDASGQRYSPLVVPHFTFGVQLTGRFEGETLNHFDQDSGGAFIPNKPCPIYVALMDYAKNDRNEIVGAKIAIGVAAYSRPTPFGGVAHLNFQGYAHEPSTLDQEIGA